MVRRILLVALIAAVVGSAGCRHCCKRQSSRGERIPPPPARDGFLDAPVSPSGGAYIPPPSLPTAPAIERRSDPLPPASIPAPDTNRALPPPTLNDRTDSFRPNRVDLDPDPLPPGGSSSSPSKQSADPLLLPPGESRVSKVMPNGTVPGVERFTVVGDGLASGRKPQVEGFDSLAARGYRTAVYLHAPGADTSAVRDLAERKNLRFIGVAVSPEAIKANAPKFAEAVGTSNRPVVVLDDTGERAGVMWYLYFRTVQGQSNDIARIRATPLGLPDAAETAWWLAIQDYLANR